MNDAEILQIELSAQGLQIKSLLEEQARCTNRNMWVRWIEIERDIMEICGQGTLFPEMLENVLEESAESEGTSVSSDVKEPPTDA